MDTHIAVRVRWLDDVRSYFSLGTFSSMNQARASLEEFSVNEDILAGDAMIVCDINDVSDIDNKAATIYFVTKNKSIVDISKVPTQLLAYGWFLSYDRSMERNIVSAYYSAVGVGSSHRIRQIAYKILAVAKEKEKLTEDVLDAIDRVSEWFLLDYPTISKDPITSDALEYIRKANDTGEDEDYLAASIYCIASYVVIGEITYILEGLTYLRNTDEYEASKSIIRDIIPINVIMSAYAEMLKR